MPQKRLHLVISLIFGISIILVPSRAKTQPAAGPLQVLAGNPRYFTADGKNAVYLTGSHT